MRPITVLHLLTHTAGMGYGPMLGDEADGEAEERFLPVITRAGRGRTSPSDPSAITTLEQWCNEIATVPLRSRLLSPGGPRARAVQGRQVCHREAPRITPDAQELNGNIVRERRQDRPGSSKRQLKLGFRHIPTEPIPSAAPQGCAKSAAGLGVRNVRREHPSLSDQPLARVSV